MTHTPGPWHRNIKPARKYPIIFAGRNTHICQVLNHVADAEVEANCDLIAMAPVLRELVDDLWWFMENVTDEDPSRTKRFFALRERVRATYPAEPA